MSSGRRRFKINAKTRCEGGPIKVENTKDEPARKSRDKIINKEINNN